MNILLIQLKRIGDLILTTPAIAALRAKFPEATISLHRKKATNTLYTINALNMLVAELNGGKLDQNAEIERVHCFSIGCYRDIVQDAFPRRLVFRPEPRMP